MAKPFTPPPYARYNGSPQPVPIPLFTKPSEGPKSVAVNILWQDYGSFPNPFSPSNTNVAVLVDLVQGNIPRLQQIGAYFIDNRLCSLDVVVFQTDTQTSFTIAAGSSDWFPANTNRRDFIIQALGIALSSDQTFIGVINEFVPPSRQKVQIENSQSNPLVVVQQAFQEPGSLGPSLNGGPIAQALSTLALNTPVSQTIQNTSLGPLIFNGCEVSIDGVSVANPIPADWTTAGGFGAIPTVRMRVLDGANNVFWVQRYSQPWGTVQATVERANSPYPLNFKTTTGLFWEVTVVIGLSTGTFSTGNVRIQPLYRTATNGE